MNKKSKEKMMIVESPRRRPYGAKLSVWLGNSVRTVFNGEACLITDADYIIKATPVTPNEKEKSLSNPKTGFQEWNIFVEGFATAGEAEKKGLEVAFGIFWGGISDRYSLSLQYQTPLPCVVYDRTQQGSGIFLSEEISLITGKPLAHIARDINEGLSSQAKGDEKILLAMELFTSAGQEKTERSHFIGLVSSIEPLAEQQNYNQEVKQETAKLKEQLQESGLPSHVKNSLSGRLDEFSTESVSSAIRRLVQETLPEDREALNIVQEAYNLRSRILHEGKTDADLSQKSQELENIIRRIIASKISLNLRS